MLAVTAGRDLVRARRRVLWDACGPDPPAALRDRVEVLAPRGPELDAAKLELPAELLAGGTDRQVDDAISRLGHEHAARIAVIPIGDVRDSGFPIALGYDGHGVGEALEDGSDGRGAHGCPMRPRSAQTEVQSGRDGGFLALIIEEAADEAQRIHVAHRMPAEDAGPQVLGYAPCGVAVLGQAEQPPGLDQRAHVHPNLVRATAVGTVLGDQDFALRIRERVESPFGQGPQFGIPGKAVALGQHPEHHEYAPVLLRCVPVVLQPFRRALDRVLHAAIAGEMVHPDKLVQIGGAADIGIRALAPVERQLTERLAPAPREKPAHLVGGLPVDQVVVEVSLVCPLRELAHRAVPGPCVHEPDARAQAIGEPVPPSPAKPRPASVRRPGVVVHEAIVAGLVPSGSERLEQPVDHGLDFGESLHIFGVQRPHGFASADPVRVNTRVHGRRVEGRQTSGPGLGVTRWQRSEAQFMRLGPPRGVGLNA